MKVPSVRTSPSVASALRDLVDELEGRDSRSAAERRRRDEEERARARRATWLLTLLAPLVAASFLFRAAAPSFLGIEEPTAAERHLTLASELHLMIEEIEAYREEHEVLVSDLTVIDRFYGEGVRFEALSERRYRLTLARHGETITHVSPPERETASESPREARR